MDADHGKSLVPGPFISGPFISGPGRAGRRSCWLCLAAALVVGGCQAGPTRLEPVDIGVWDTTSLPAGQAADFIVTQESPLARKQQDDRTAEAFIFRFGSRGAIQRLAAPPEVLGPRGVRYDDGAIVFVDAFDSAVKRIDADGMLTTIYRGSPLTFPRDVAIDPQGNYIVADFDSFRATRRRGIYRISRDGQISTVFSGPPLQWPHGVSVDDAGNILVADPTGSVFRIDRAGRLETVASGDPLIGPQDIKVEPSGDYVVTDLGFSVDPATGRPDPQKLSRSTTLYRISPEGSVEVILRRRGARFRAVALHPDGGYVVVNFGVPGRKDYGSLIRVFSDGTATTIHAGEPFFQPAGVAVVERD